MNEKGFYLALGALCLVATWVALVTIGAWTPPRPLTMESFETVRTSP
jgi:hypothetical protein